MTGGASARLAVVLCGDREETFRRSLEAFRRQTACESIEMILVRWRDAGFEIRDGAGEFAALRVVEVAPGTSLPAARADGARTATAPLVFFCETHAYPRPEWAEAVLEASCEGGHAVVSSAFENANPRTAVSWAGFVSDYGAWMPDRPAGAIAEAPIHKGSYPRDDLLALGDRLASALSAGDELGLALARLGREPWFEPRARIVHHNVADLRPWLRGRFLIGFAIGANRAGRWTIARRLAYGLAWPAIAVVLFARALPLVRRARRLHPLPRGVVAAIAAGAVSRSAGEALAYLCGDLPSMRARVDDYELHESMIAVGAGR